MYNKYWNHSDEELLREAFSDENCGELAHELAMRLAHLLDEPEAIADPEWVSELREEAK
jgi:hypothetical protein